mmetsp:Transcript_61320/g.68662  ORF Transcript_61320/g.68662 Transcript_61320/m.68662 type:complete len:128 (-) Transcript_61320:300-683(-)
MNEHGFVNIFDRYNEDDDCNVNGFASTMENDDDADFEFNPSKPVANGYMSIQPLVKECSLMIIDEGKLAIANKHLTRMREELYSVSNNDVSKKRKSQNNNGGMKSLPACEKHKTYKRLAPHGSPSHK